MAHSPLGRVPFTALDRNWTLKFGNAARFRVEQEFQTGFARAVLDCFPNITTAAIEDGTEAALAAAMADPLGLRLASIAMMFKCGIAEPIDDDSFDDMVDELGYSQITELMAAAFAASNPPATKDAAADAATGEGKRRKRTPPS